MADRARGQRWWLAVLLVLSLLPVSGLFSTTRIFYVRDLSFFFWSRHLWLRHTILSGQAPWWDPYVAAGQSAIADALNQIVMPIALAIRLLPSDVVSFNLWVALPLPIAALGMFVFLRRLFADEADAAPASPPDAAHAVEASPPARAHAAAAFGACVFAASGPVVSMINLPNLAWSVAFLPWVLAAASAPSPLRRARAWQVAVAYGLQALCGEPVTWVSTGVLAACWIVISRLKAGATYNKAGPIYSRAGAVDGLRLIAGLALGGMLAAAQLVPTAFASLRAHRAALATPDFWSLHPVSLWETLAPQLFGSYYDAFLADLPWMGALNFGRDPFFYSLYVGPLVLVLALAGAVQFRRNGFWVAVALAFTIAALGGYTPLYPLARRLVPTLMYFRFPVKYFVFAVFAVAVLAASGWRQGRGLVWGPALAGSLVLVMTLSLVAMPASLHAGTYALAVATHLKDAAAGAEFLARSAPPLALRAAGMLILAALLAALSRRRPYAWWLLAAVTCADILWTAASLNPTMEVTRVTPPAWFTAASGPQRVYIGGRARGYMNADDPDAVSTWQIPAAATAVEGRMELNALLPMAPSGWRVREALSYDLPYLWPAEYEAALKQFESADRAQREAFLRRAGVRWCVLPSAVQRPWRVVAEVSDWNMAVFECGAGASRLAFTSGVRGLDAMFDPSLPDNEPIGDARFVEDAASQVTIEATVARQGILVLRDSYDPSWRAEVDGRPASILRADGLYRGVALSPGRHVIRFSYRPREFLAGLILSVTAVLIIGFSGFSGFFGFSRFSRFSVLPVRPAMDRQNQPDPERPTVPRRDDRGFTLIELMVVLAIIGIVLAISFTEYRNMQARGNEASALSSMRSIAAAQWQFALTCGNLKYATTLPGLGQPVPATGQPFLSPDLTSGEIIEKSGYEIRMVGKPVYDAAPACNGVPVAAGYAATADPIKPGTSGMRFYGVNTDRVLYLDEEKSFKEDLPETGAAPHGQEVK